MPSDLRMQHGLDAVRDRIAAFRHAASAAAAHARGMLAADGSAERARVELGSLGAMRIDFARFAELTRGAVLDGAARALVTSAADVLGGIADSTDEAFVVRVEAGERAATRIQQTLARLGRAFVAAQTTDLVRGGRMDVARQHDPQADHGIVEWSSTERAMAPPLVVVVNGGDLHACELSDFLDGATHLAIVIEGPCPAAAVARLITPGTFVLQTVNERGLDQFREAKGPAVAAFVDDEAACFVHDPTRGAAPWERLEIWKQPTAGPRKRIGGLSVWQQREDLAQLLTLATQPVYPTSPAGDPIPAGSDAVDRLTEWLLTEAGLAGAAQ